MRFGLKAILLAIIVAASFYYWQGAVKQLAFVNTDLTTTDQDATMDYARKLAESGYTFGGDRNRMPVYPFLQSLFYRPGMTGEDFFVTGKYNNLVLSLVLLGLVGVILFRMFNGLHALVLLLIFAFTLFIFKAGYFQAELLILFSQPVPFPDAVKVNSKTSLAAGNPGRGYSRSGAPYQGFHPSRPGPFSGHSQPENSLDHLPFPGPGKPERAN